MMMCVPPFRVLTNDNGKPNLHNIKCLSSNKAVKFKTEQLQLLGSRKTYLSTDSIADNHSIMLCIDDAECWHLISVIVMM